MKTKYLAMLAAATLIIPVGALAQAKPTKSDPRIDLIFVELDANKDGKVTKEEREAFRTSQFKGADKNNDGVLDSVEMAAFVRTRSTKRINDRFTAFDVNKDGKLTLDEFPGRTKRRMWRADANADGAVTKAEMTKAAEQRMGRRLARSFRRLDVDRDGKLSRNEFVDGGFVLFRMADRNRDGAVTREELVAVFARFDQRRGWSRGKRSGQRWRHHRWHRGRDGDRRRGYHRGRGDRDRTGLTPLQTPQVSPSRKL